MVTRAPVSTAKTGTIVGVITPTDGYRTPPMATPGEADLVAVVAARRAAAEVIRRHLGRRRRGRGARSRGAAGRARRAGRAARAHAHRRGDGERRAVPGGIPVPEGTAAVVVTSGTTAHPKGVELTYDGIDAIGHGWAAAMGHEPDDHWLVCVPLHHVAGLAILARASVTGAAVTVRDAFDLDDVATAPGTIGATLVSVVPTMLGRLLDAGAPMHEYRRIVTGGAPLSDALLRPARTTARSRWSTRTGRARRGVGASRTACRSRARVCASASRTRSRSPARW